MAAFKTTSTGHVDDLINLLTEDFAIHSFWRRRQMYIYICHKLVSVLYLQITRKYNCLSVYFYNSIQISEKVLSDERFEEAFLEPLLNLAKDFVPNIRLNVANLLSKALIDHG